MSIASSLSALAAAKNDIAEAITAKGGTVGTGAGFTSFADAIATIPSGGAPASVSPKDINFYDYDGRIVAAWTLSELADKEELPPNPSHEGLTAQGWNWTLADLKAENAPMNVGQMYITDDGKTRLYIRISQYGRMTVPLHWNQSADSGVTIDWGDNSTPETYTGTGNKNTTHTYASVGDYVITLEVTSGTMRLGNGTDSNCVLGSTGAEGRVYINMLQKVEIGNGVQSIGDYAFYNCRSLASITIPSSVTNIGNYAFSTCRGVAHYYVYPTTPPALGGGSVFANIPSDCTIHVPAVALDDYKTAQYWVNLASRMVGDL